MYFYGLRPHALVPLSFYAAPLVDSSFRFLLLRHKRKCFVKFRFFLASFPFLELRNEPPGQTLVDVGHVPAPIDYRARLAVAVYTVDGHLRSFSWLPEFQNKVNDGVNGHANQGKVNKN